MIFVSQRHQKQTNLIDSDFFWRRLCAGLNLHDLQEWAFALGGFTIRRCGAGVVELTIFLNGLICRDFGNLYCVSQIQI